MKNFSAFNLRIGVLFLFFSLISIQAFSQFSYAGVRLSYYNVRFDKGGSFDPATRMNDLAVNLDFISRPVRNFGIGISARIPVIHGFKYVFARNDNFADFVEGSGKIENQETIFAEGDLGYFIKNTFSITLLGRIYFTTESPIYLDLRYTFETYNEEFTYNRSASSSLPQENIDFSENTLVRGVGFTFGYAPEIADNFFFNYAFTVDFLGTDEISFNYLIAENEFNGTTSIRKFTSKIDDTQTAYEISMGLLYRF